MKRTLRLIIIISLVFLFSFKSDDNCKEYFSGKWKYDRFDVEYIFVERTHEKQFEYMEDGKYYYEFDIKWITDCKYELIYKGTTSPNPADAKIGEKLIIEIIKINDTLMEYKTVFRDLKEFGKMTRIE